MDRYEVTTGQYAEFLVLVKQPAPWQWENVDLAQHRDRPVIGVSWFDADAYLSLARQATSDRSRVGKGCREGPMDDCSPGETKARLIP